MAMNYRQHKKICKKLGMIYLSDATLSKRDGDLELVPRDEASGDERLVCGFCTHDSWSGDYTIVTIDQYFRDMFFYSDKFIDGNGNYMHHKLKKRHNFMHVLRGQETIRMRGLIHDLELQAA